MPIPIVLYQRNSQPSDFLHHKLGESSLVKGKDYVLLVGDPEEVDKMIAPDAEQLFITGAFHDDADLEATTRFAERMAAKNPSLTIIGCSLSSMDGKVFSGTIVKRGRGTSYIDELIEIMKGFVKKTLPRDPTLP